MKEICLGNYEGMIRKAAWFYHSIWKTIDYKDLKAQGFLIFMEAVNKFEKNRMVCFSTYLFIQLKALNQYCKKEMRERAALHYGNYKDYFHSNIYERFVQAVDFYDSLNKELSKDAEKIIKYILDWGFTRKLSFHSVKKYFNSVLRWFPSRIKKAWKEVKSWWLCYEF